MSFDDRDHKISWIFAPMNDLQMLPKTISVTTFFTTFSSSFDLFPAYALVQ